MGILRNKERRYEPIRIEDLQDEGLVNEYANYLFDSDFSDSDEFEGQERNIQTSAPSYESHRKKKSKRYRQHYGPIEMIDGFQVKRNMGAQKWRRIENAKLIMDFTDGQDICIDGSDLVEETITAFTRLLRDDAKMKIWNEFIESDEAKQAKMIKKIEQEIENEKCKPCSSKKLTGDKQAELRKHHPAYCSGSCFEQLDKKLRNCLLKRRHLQFDYMEKTEKSLREFFNEFSSGVYFEDIACRVKRFYVHAVAQFLSLNSQTIDASDSKKLVQVENTKPSFTPPDIFLCTFLKKKRRSKWMARNGADWEEG